MRVLLTTTSYQDTPGPHHALLAQHNYQVHCERGPLPESKLLELAGDFDAFLCGDDEITARVIAHSLPRLRVISKYGVGLDKIDLAECARRNLPVLYTPGMNHASVAEHTFALMLALSRQLVSCVNEVRQGRWTRLTGHELAGKKIGVIGLGFIGREVIKRAVAFGMSVHALTRHWPREFADEYSLTRHDTIESLLAEVSLLTLHLSLNNSTKHLIGERELSLCRQELLLINTARAELVKTSDLIAALDRGVIAGYGADVLDQEPPNEHNPLLTHPKVILTPHIASRTYESVARQAMRATLNLVNYLNGNSDYIQADIPSP